MISWHEGDVLTNGIRIHYYRSGGDGPPLVLLHGITDNGLCWPRVSEALADKYDIIGVDARGHGKSEKPDFGAAYAREEHGRDVAGLIEALNLGKPAVIGHSMGSATASYLAATYPNLVSTLVLEDPPWRVAGSMANAAQHSREWAQRITDRKKLNREELLAQGKQDNPAWDDVEFDNWMDAKYQVGTNVAGFVSATPLTWEDQVAKFECPTLLITADPKLEAIVTPEIAQEAKSLNSKVQVVNIPNAGHNIRREQFDGYMQAVLDYLAQEYPAT